jgi:hypothetical protein
MGDLSFFSVFHSANIAISVDTDTPFGQENAK